MKRISQFLEEMMLAVAFAEEGVNPERRRTNYHPILLHLKAREILRDEKSVSFSKKVMGDSE